MKHIFAISDIHGELDLFQELLDQINYTPKHHHLILLGDFVDRGPKSSQVLDTCKMLKEQGATLLLGNHEVLMYRCLTSDDEFAWTRWIKYGGAETLQSYGFSPKDYRLTDANGKFKKPKLVSQKLLEDLAFIQTFDLYYEENDFIFVHAGINPYIPFADNTQSDLLWIREKFHQHYDGEKTIIFGHTPTHKLHQNPDKHDVYFGVNRIIGIDGGASVGGQLNCLELPSMTVTSIKAKKKEPST